MKRSFRAVAAAMLLGLLGAAGVASARDIAVDAASLGRGVAADTATVQAAIDACAAAGGGAVLFPAGGRATVGSLRLRSRVDLQLGRGSVLMASGDPADFSITIPYPVTTHPGEAAPRIPVMLFADEAEDVAISGAGTIDGNSPAYVAEHLAAIDRAKDIRPYTVVFRACRRARLEDVTIRNGAFWTVRLLGCEDVDVTGIRIDNSLLMPNNDGIDVDWSARVRIRGCHIVSGDDCIALKTAPESMGITRPCEDVVITGCTLQSKSSALVIGSDVVGAIRDVVVDSCTIRDSHRGVSVRLNMSGTMERISFSNLTITTRLYDPAWWGRGTPIDVVVTPWNSVTKAGTVRDIRFRDIVCQSENGVVVYGYSPGLIEGVTFDGVDVTIDKTTELAGGHQDFRPAPTDDFPAMPTAGFLLRRAAGVVIRDCRVRWGEHRPDYFGHALDAEACPSLVLSGFAGEAAHPGMTAVRVAR